jgi:hypothetical protein
MNQHNQWVYYFIYEVSLRSYYMFRPSLLGHHQDFVYENVISLYINDIRPNIV